MLKLSEKYKDIINNSIGYIWANPIFKNKEEYSKTIDIKKVVENFITYSENGEIKIKLKTL